MAERPGAGGRRVTIWTAVLLLLLAAAGIATFLLLPPEAPPADPATAPSPLPLYRAVLDDDAAVPRPVIVDVVVPEPATMPPTFGWFVGVLNEQSVLPGALRLARFEQSEEGLIAVVELVPSADSPASDRWYQAFQGSTGAYATELAIRWNLLQPHYAGAWPDGLRLLYRGEPMHELDHIDLSGIILRAP